MITDLITSYEPNMLAWGAIPSMTDRFLVMNVVVVMVHSSLLAVLAARFMSSQVVQTRKTSLATQMVPLAYQMLVFRTVGGYVPSKVRAISVEKLIAYMTISLVLARMGRQMRQQDLLVHEGLGAAREGAFEETAIVACAGI